jgi:hypothetical protein
VADADHFDMFTLDTTVIATGLGQLVDEGRIDEDAKPYLHVAVKRQLGASPSAHRPHILRLVRRVFDAA